MTPYTPRKLFSKLSLTPSQIRAIFFNLDIIELFCYCNNVIIPKSKYYLGVYVEKLIHEALPDSILMRKDRFDIRSPFDIKWKDLKIEVKTSHTIYSNSDPNSDNFYMQFSIFGSKADVYVFIGFCNNKLYYWIKSPMEFNVSVYLKSKDAFTDLRLLQKEILNAIGRENPDILLLKTVSSSVTPSTIPSTHISERVKNAGPTIKVKGVTTLKEKSELPPDMCKHGFKKGLCKYGCK